MKNLAGDMKCNPIIRRELNEAGIEVVEHPVRLPNEVPAGITGQLTHNGLPGFTFVRAWYYWVVKGEVPLAVAKVLYTEPTGVGQRDVRVAGHCGCPPPEEWAFPREKDFWPILEKMGIGSISNRELAGLCNSGQISAPRFVFEYHIDSQEGLNLFVRVLREHDLVD